MYINQHKVVSISICSYVPDFTNPKCLVNDDLDTLLDEFVQELEKIQESTQALYLEENKHVEEAINAINVEEASEKQCNLKQQWNKYISQLICLAFNGQKYDLP